MNSEQITSFTRQFEKIFGPKSNDRVKQKKKRCMESSRGAHGHGLRCVLDEGHIGQHEYQVE